MRRVIKQAAGVIGLFAILGTTASATQPVNTAGQGVVWQDCGDGLQCGSITVPADWAAPATSPRISIGLAKLPARDQARKRGTLLVNPGGPAQAIEYLPADKARYADLTTWFDVVMFDPRGFGKSSGVTCPNPAPFILDWPSPAKSVYKDFATANTTFAQDCAQAIGPLRGNLNSWQVAHDMDAMRVALGERKLTYFGNSYGTVFGQAYAELFGRNLARMYLDSVLDHTDRDPYSWTLSKATTAEHDLRLFAGWCARTESCALHGQDVLAVWDRVIAKAPIPAPGAGPGATASASLIVAQSRVTHEASWPRAATALAQADAGDASLYVPPMPPPPGALPPNLSRIMMCADFPYETRYEAVMQIEEKLRGDAPRLGWVHAWSTAAVHCAGLPKSKTFPPHPIQPAGVPPVLITSGSTDATTPPAHGRRVAAQLPGAQYLPTVGGHALYLSGNPCVRGHVHNYLLTGQLPASGASCP
jgi:pimeloyl-ACP methyl ester carboxylesterase